MTPERYQQIGDLYHAALEVDADERSAFLDRACAGDLLLRGEVESLIASHEESADFIAEPALALAARVLAESDDAALVGRTIARYRVLSLLGAGGMGQVYLAEDTELGRRVALKLLPEHFTNDKNQVQRFRQEARAASALNHPGILTVYEVGQVDGIEFIAAEYVEGETLRARLQRGPCGVREALDAAAQIAAALSAAHAAGIVHRDVKPENVMLRRDGYIKILDFGLAKLTETRAAPSPAGSVIRTNPGVVMGTAEYMSPEQARGLAVDARTDVWSLGCVIYELLAGRRPFGGETQGDTIVAILEREPAPLLRHAPDVPAELERIVTKALAKDREERYQTVKDMAIDLRRLRRQLDIENELERSALTPSGGDGATVGSGAATATDTHRGARASDAGTTRTTSNIEYVVGEINRHKRGAVFVVVTLILLLGGAGYGLYRFLSRPKPAAMPFQTTKVTRLTATGKALDAAISPDGKYVVYVESDAEQPSLWVKQVATGSSVRIVPPADVFYWGITFSNDSNYVYYVRNEKSNPRNVLYQVPSYGGVSRKLIEQVDSAVAFSPDGKRLAFVRDFLKKEETALVLANVDGSGERTLATRRSPQYFWSDLAVRVAWSPDGSTIACPTRNRGADSYYYDVVGVSVEDGSEKPLTSRRWGQVRQVAWLSGGDGLVLVASEEGAAAQLWHLSYPGGEARRITNDLNAHSGVTLTADSGALVTVQRNRVSNIWVAPKGDEGHARQISSGTLDGESGLTWTPGGQIVYRSDASGKSHIWVMDVDGSNQRQLTQDGEYNTRPSVSPDGRYIVFASSRAGKVNVWRMDADGGNQQQLTDGKMNSNPHLSPDGRWVVYASWDHGNGTLWKVPIDGGDPVRLSDPTANLPVVSPDGKHIACFYWDEQATPTRGAMILPFEGGAPTKRFNIGSGQRLGFVLHWTPDGRALLYLDTRNIWSQPVDGGDPVQLTDFEGDQIFNFDYSPDGKWLAAARGRVTNDVVLISDAK